MHQLNGAKHTIGETVIIAVNIQHQITFAGGLGCQFPLEGGNESVPILVIVAASERKEVLRRYA